MSKEMREMNNIKNTEQTTEQVTEQVKETALAPKKANVIPIEDISIEELSKLLESITDDKSDAKTETNVTNTANATSTSGTVSNNKTGNTTSSGNGVSYGEYKSYYGNYKSYTKNYDYKGVKNVTTYPDFVKICRFSQSSLKKWLKEKLLNLGYTDVVSGDGYLYTKGTIPVLLTAHMDTVHKNPIEDFYEYYDEEKEQHILSSPQGIGGDDRCGVYMILEIIKTHKCSVLFCEDEEIGGIGSDKFCKTDLLDELCELKYLIELDRKGNNDAVFYDCDNDDFTKFIEDNTGYKDDWGSFSDISTLSPSCWVASVNLSCGYYNAHTTSEYVIMEEMFNTIEVVKKLLEVECEQFEYVERVHYNYNRNSYGYGGYYGGYYGKWDDYDGYNDPYDDTYYGGYYGKSSTKSASKNTGKERSLFVYVYDEEVGDVITYVANGTTSDEAFGKFFRSNPELCFNDVFDWDFYENKLYDDGWYSYL